MQVLAIDLGGTHATCALVRDTSILAAQTVPTRSEVKLAAVLPQLAQVLRDLCCQSGVPFGNCDGLALGFCGLADYTTGRVLSTNQKYDDAPELDLPAWAEQEFGLPFHIENDARMALLGERSAGAARGFDNVVMMTLGTGIGGAAMMGGKLVRGRHAQAGCLGGHFCMNPRGRRCTCGAIGCAESEASTWALPYVCLEWSGFADSLLARSPQLNYATLFQAADRGDPVAEEIAQYSIDVWGALAVSLIHAYDPEVLVIGGGIMRSAGRILPEIQKRVLETAWTPWGKVVLRAAECGEQAALLGAVPLFAGED